MADTWHLELGVRELEKLADALTQLNTLARKGVMLEEGYGEPVLNVSGQEIRLAYDGEAREWRTYETCTASRARVQEK